MYSVIVYPLEDKYLTLPHVIWNWLWILLGDTQTYQVESAKQESHEFELLSYKNMRLIQQNIPQKKKKTKGAKKKEERHYGLVGILRPG